MIVFTAGLKKNVDCVLNVSPPNSKEVQLERIVEWWVWKLGYSIDHIQEVHRNPGKSKVAEAYAKYRNWGTCKTVGLSVLLYAMYVTSLYLCTQVQLKKEFKCLEIHFKVFKEMHIKCLEIHIKENIKNLTTIEPYLFVILIACLRNIL